MDMFITTRRRWFTSTRSGVYRAAYHALSSTVSLGSNRVSLHGSNSTLLNVPFGRSVRISLPSGS